MKNNYLLINGSFGSPFVNWFPWLRKEIENKGLEVYTPDFPTGVGFQNYDLFDDKKVTDIAGITGDWQEEPSRSAEKQN